MTEHWSQTKPYNDLMPRYITEADAKDGPEFVAWDGKAPTGCVATQMAQLFHYWNWPRRFDYLYSSGVSQSVAVEDKGKYSIVLQVNGWVPYSFDESDLTKARLSFLAAVLGKSNFNRNGSGGRPEVVANSLAENNVEARKYYDYKGMTSDWKVIKPYLEAGFPLPAEYIPKTGTGHAFVIQGWKEGDKGTYVYKHNGNGGAGNGWISTSEVTNVFLFYPKMRVQIDRLPSHTTGELEVSWAFPEQYMKLYSETELSGFQFKVINPYNKGSAEIDEPVGREVRSKKVSFSGTGTYYISIVPNFYSKNIAPSVVEDTFMIEVSASNYEEPKIEYAPPSIEASFGETCFEVKCSKSVTSIDLHPGILTIHENESFSMESALSVVKKSEGLFQVTINAAKLPTRFNHQKMLLTLEAKDRNWVADYADVLVEFKTSASSSGNPGTDPKKLADYILISPKDFVKDWTSYIEKRKIAHEDLTFAVKNADEIYNGYSPKYDGDSPQAKIKAFIAEQAKLGAKYFVLGGASIYEQKNSNGTTGYGYYLARGEKSDDVTTITASLDNGLPGWMTTVGSLGTVANDYEYALVDGDDLVPDVILARIPVIPWEVGSGEDSVIPTFSEIIAGYGEKVAKVESDKFAGRHRYACAGGRLGQDKTPWQVYKTSPLYPTERHSYCDGYLDFFDPKHPDPAADGEIAARRRFRNHFARYNPVNGGMVILDNGDKNPEGNDAKTFFASDWEALIVKSHGQAYESSNTGLKTALYETSTHLVKFNIYAMPCLTGIPDGTGSYKGVMDVYTGKNTVLKCPSLGEAAIMNPYGGSVVGYHNTRLAPGFNEQALVVDFKDGFATNMEGFILDALCGVDKDIGRLDAGKTWKYAHEKYVLTKSANYSDRHEWCLRESILYGDPLIKLSEIKEGEKVCGPGAVPAKVLFK